jgi:hypothetical protein
VHETETRIARGAFAAPVLEDMDKDGKLDIIQAAFDGKIYVFRRRRRAWRAGPSPCITRDALRRAADEPHPHDARRRDFNGDGIAGSARGLE